MPNCKSIKEKKTGVGGSQNKTILIICHRNVSFFYSIFFVLRCNHSKFQYCLLLLSCLFYLFSSFLQFFFILFYFCHINLLMVLLSFQCLHDFGFSPSMSMKTKSLVTEKRDESTRKRIECVLFFFFLFIININKKKKYFYYVCQLFLFLSLFSIRALSAVCSRFVNLFAGSMIISLCLFFFFSSFFFHFDCFLCVTFAQSGIRSTLIFFFFIS